MVYLWVGLYLVSGIAQPLLVDSCKYHGGTKDWPPTLLPLLSNCLGMMLVGTADLFMRLDGKGQRLRRESFPKISTEVLTIACVIDFAFGIFSFSGLQLCGSGVFTVIYSSTTAWTAIIAWLFVGQRLSQGQWLGIGTVTLGLLLNGLSVYDQAENEAKDENQHALLGAILTLLGTIIHAAGFVYNERIIKVLKVSPLDLCAQLGLIEASIILAYNFVLVLFYGVHELYFDSIEAAGSNIFQVIIVYLFLIFADCIHAIAFFAMLGKLGAVTTGVLKAILAVTVFTIAATFFCQYEPSQCYTPFKAMSMMIVLFGSIIYILAKTSTPTAKI